MKHKFFRRLALIAVTCLALTSCTSGNNANKTVALLDAANAKLDSAVAQRMNLSKTKVYNASVIPAYEEMSFDVDGYIYGIYVTAGTEVEEGDVIASLVSKGYDELKSLKTEIKNLQSSNEENFKKTEAEIELAKLAGEDTTERELNAKHEKELAELRLQIKKERLAQLEADDIGFRYIVAPRDSIAVAALSARKGTFVRAGSNVVALESDGEVMITCDYFSEKTASRLHDYYALIDGQRIELEYVPYSKKELKDLSTNEIDPVSKFRIKSVPAGYTVSAGDYVTVVSVSDYKEDVLAIPANAIYSDSTGQFVYVVENDNRIRKNVVTGVSDSTYIEIVSGIEEGETVYVKD
ncbi:MAG: hypothetical protein K6E85_17195 [Lachnospiraceae bacterium]|nr:hypothetical protein [Lachnospiraceae bacterium]